MATKEELKALPEAEADGYGCRVRARVSGLLLADTSSAVAFNRLTVELASEAINMARKTGYSPMTLRNHREELLDTLRSARNLLQCFVGGPADEEGSVTREVDSISAVIAKVES